jgi:hypothetical protein
MALLWIFRVFRTMPLPGEKCFSRVNKEQTEAALSAASAPIMALGIDHQSCFLTDPIASYRHGCDPPDHTEAHATCCMIALPRSRHSDQRFIAASLTLFNSMRFTPLSTVGGRYILA